MTENKLRYMQGHLELLTDRMIPRGMIQPVPKLDFGRPASPESNPLPSEERYFSSAVESDTPAVQKATTPPTQEGTSSPSIKSAGPTLAMSSYERAKRDIISRYNP